jgi:hypothetical protein
MEGTILSTGVNLILANGIRVYKNKVRLRGLAEKSGVF